MRLVLRFSAFLCAALFAGAAAFAQSPPPRRALESYDLEGRRALAQRLSGAERAPRILAAVTLSPANFGSEAGPKLILSTPLSVDRGGAAFAAGTGAIVLDVAGWTGAPLLVDCHIETDARELRWSGAIFSGARVDVAAAIVLDRVSFVTPPISAQSSQVVLSAPLGGRAWIFRHCAVSRLG